MHRDNTPSSTQTAWIGRVLSIEPELLVRDVFQAHGRPVEVTGSTAVEVGCFVSLRGAPHASIRPTVVEVLANPGSARAAIYQLVAAEGLDPSFPPAVEAEVAALLRDPCIDDPDLEDLTDRPFVTVDGEHTRDLDQALFIERREDGCRVWYALADASFYVRPGMALFREALRRGASYYLPGLVVPMLPRPLSENLISLNEGVARRATVFRMDLDQQGRCQRTELVRARIKSFAKLSFDAVQQFYDAPDESALSASPFAESLRLLREVGNLRIQDAEQRDVVRYRRTEVEVGLDDDEGLRFVVVDDLRREVERYNEQLSLLCNIEGARYLFLGDRPDDNVQPIYRVHPRPRAERIEEFESLLKSLAAQHGLAPSTWTWKRSGGPSLAAFLTALPTDSSNAGVARAIHRQAIMLNLRSSFSERAGEHYGVGAELYARFSSPMREIVGVYVHKEAWEKATGAQLPLRWTAAPATAVDDDELRVQVVRIANVAKDIQKKLDKVCNGLVLDRMFSRELAATLDHRPVRTGTVMGLTRSKAHILLDSPHLDVKVYASHVARQRGVDVDIGAEGASWRDEHGSTILRLGDRVSVRLIGREDRGDRWVLELT
jgi:ribonuclease R